MYAIAVRVAIGLTTANFLWAALSKRDWGHAAELSFFQVGALVVFLVVFLVLH